MGSEYWQREEILPLRELEEIQLRRLRWTVRYAYENVPFYRKRLKEKGVHPDDIRRLEDISKLPFTTRDDLKANYPFGLFAVPRERIVRIHTSSGTSGKPKVVGYTHNDLENWINLVARCLYMVGVRSNDTFQNMVSYTLFTGGLGFHYAAERIGAMVVPSGTGNTAKQIEYMLDFGTTAIHCTPSYALRIREVAEEMGVDLAQLPLRIGCFGAEPWSESTRKKLENAFSIDAFDSYGLSEMNGPGVAFECREKDGLHIWIDHYLVEVIDPETGEVLGEGEKGELVVTTLSKEALPLIRWRTGDITVIEDETCGCGRTHPRIMRILGRADDMIIVRGVNVFPSQIEHVLMGIPELGEHYTIILDRTEDGLDEMTIEVELSENASVDRVSDILELEKRVSEMLKSVLNVWARVRVVNPGTLQRFEGKARRIVDRRRI